MLTLLLALNMSIMNSTMQEFKSKTANLNEAKKHYRGRCSLIEKDCQQIQQLE